MRRKILNYHRVDELVFLLLFICASSPTEIKQQHKQG